MKKFIALILSLTFVLTLVGCGDNIVDETEETKDVVAEDDKWGILLIAENVTPTGLTLKIEQSGGNPSGSLEFGAAYLLENMVNNEWQELETITGEPLAWNMLAYIIKMNDVTETQIDWQYSYGELKPGKYRIKKEIMDFRDSGDYDTKIYFAEFEIKE